MYTISVVVVVLKRDMLQTRSKRTRHASHRVAAVALVVYADLSYEVLV